MIPTAALGMAALLQVRNLKIYFDTMAGMVKAVDGISYRIDGQEIVCLVEEDGCSKTVSQLSESGHFHF